MQWPRRVKISSIPKIELFFSRNYELTMRQPVELFRKKSWGNNFKVIDIKYDTFEGVRRACYIYLFVCIIMYIEPSCMFEKNYNELKHGKKVPFRGKILNKLFASKAKIKIF